MGKRRRTAGLLHLYDEELDGSKVVTNDEVLSTDGRRVIRKTGTFFAPPSPTKATASRPSDAVDGTSACPSTRAFTGSEDVPSYATEEHQIWPRNARKGKTAASFATLSWNGRFFKKIDLKDIGLVVQLGHAPGEKCPAPSPAPRDFLVIHTNGFHPINVLYCQCDRVHIAGTRVQQLLRSELFPATMQDPHTCCTFRVLETFHILTLQSKINQYDYYKSLEKLTDNTGLRMRYDRLKSFLRMVREWRHLKALKRAGRGHESGGIDATGPGDLCVRCPACPRPGFNLPANWQDAPDDVKFIYTMFIAIDANFRLKRRAISNETRDPALGSGLGYFVEDTTYRAHLAEYVDQEEICTCTGLAALLQANKRWSKGYAATGVGMACCVRHGFILPNGVGDLQVGERYCNMDFIWMSVLKLLPPELLKVLSYDIVCQWIKNLLERIASFPHHLFVEVPTGNIRYVIPKYHLRAHKELDHNQYSLNLLPGVGRTDGEEIERNWSRHDATSASTREMGPGARSDTLEDHFGWANWQKYVGLGTLLRARLRKALSDRAKYQELFEDFRLEVSEDNDTLWVTQVVAWERDSRKPDPYYISPSGKTEADVRLNLAEEDSEDAARGRQNLHTVTPSGLIMELLDLEDQHSGKTVTQTAQMVEKRTALRRRITNVRTVQAIYMPCVPALSATYQQTKDKRTNSVDLPEDEPLFLPSHIDLDALEACEPGLSDIENRLREGQLRDCLDKLRIQLHIKSRLVNFKIRNVRHQGANTRANKKLQDNEGKIVGYAEKYRAAWSAKLALAGAGTWQREWRILERSDVRCMTEDDPTISHEPSEGRRKISWIWLAAGSRQDGEAADLPGMADALRVEFLRARARARRFSEEVDMLEEEKRRILASLEATAAVWDCREGYPLATGCPATRQGAAAYAARQADLQRCLASTFRETWGTAQHETISDEEDKVNEGAVDEDANDGELEFAYCEDSEDDDEANGHPGTVSDDDE
ncbi:hypothetical protein EIP86_008841 [Pleurotus ostreatoroseus]|nr:hypothetical protein EIP86_008841 [Pleurotus ostreatoroseus]